MENLRFLFYLLFGLLLSCVLPAALQAEEPDRWYLISETELRSIEQYKADSEQEKQTWLLQARQSRETAERLRSNSAILNNQLSEARETNRRLEQSFGEYEKENLIQISSKNGKIADLEQEQADQAVQTEKYKGRAGILLIMVISLAGSWAVYLALKVFRLIQGIGIF